MQVVSRSLWRENADAGRTLSFSIRPVITNLRWRSIWMKKKQLDILISTRLMVTKLSLYLLFSKKQQLDTLIRRKSKVTKLSLSCSFHTTLDYSATHLCTWTLIPYSMRVTIYSSSSYSSFFSFPLDTLLGGKCSLAISGLGDLVSRSNPLTQTNPVDFQEMF